jgi:hypothetical protein
MQALAPALFPAIRRYRFTLKLTSPAHFETVHGQDLMGLIWSAIGGREKGKEFPHGVIPYACESGKTDFTEGASYCFTVTFVGDDRRLLPELIAGISRLGKTPWRGPRRPPPLRGNYILACDPKLLPMPDLNKETCRLQDAGGFITLEFLSGIYFKSRRFTVWEIFKHLKGRIEFLATGARGSERAGLSLLPDPPETCVIVDQSLHYSKNGAGKKGIAFRGITGWMTIRGVPEEWFPWLLLGQAVHIGKGPHYGMGRYLVIPSSPEEAEAVRPSADQN